VNRQRSRPDITRRGIAGEAGLVVDPLAVGAPQPDLVEETTTDAPPQHPFVRFPNAHVLLQERCGPCPGRGSSSEDKGIGSPQQSSGTIALAAAAEGSVPDVLMLVGK
jgi:hypothetical protein